MVFLHGTSGHLEAFVRNIPAHAAAGYRCHAIDMLGHGYTGKPDYPYEIPRYVEHLTAYLDAAGIPAANLVGESLGGWVAAWFAADRRCLLVDLLQYGQSEKCVITGPMWDFHAAKIAALLDALAIRAADFICNSWGGTIALNLAARYPDRVRSLVVTGSMPVFYGPLAPLPEGGRRGRNARDDYYGGTGPNLAKMADLMARLGWYDRAQMPAATVRMRYEQSIDLLAYLPAADLVVLNRCGHWPPFERPADYARLVLSFLDHPAH